MLHFLEKLKASEFNDCMHFLNLFWFILQLYYLYVETVSALQKGDLDVTCENRSLRT